MTPPFTIAGETDEDRKLWNTYMYWAHSSCSAPAGLDIYKKDRRLTQETAAALQTIVFSAFMLEYRLKRIADVRCFRFRKRDTLSKLIDNFQRHIELTNRIDNDEPVRLPDEWKRVKTQLDRLSKFRNDIAHANYAKVMDRLSDGESLPKLAAELFDAVIDAIRITNRAIGYDPSSDAASDRYYDALKAGSRKTPNTSAARELNEIT
jgi:hypothetical protein